MNIRFIETFVVLAELRSIRATAIALHATPAAISLRIKNLEQELQTKLVERSTNGFRLTGKGANLLSHAKSVLNATNTFQLAANNETPVRERLRLGVIESVVHSWFSSYVELLTDANPEFELELAIDTSDNLEQRLLAKELDLVIRIEGINSDGTASIPLASYPLRWIARRDTESSQTACLPEYFLRRPIVTFGHGTRPQRTLESIITNLCNTNNIPLSQLRIACAHSVNAMIQLIRSGYGIAAIPALFIKEQIVSGEFVELPIVPILPSFIVSMSHHADANTHVRTAANTARSACKNYCDNMDAYFITAVN